MCSTFFIRKTFLSHHSVSNLRCFHTSETRRIFDGIACFSVGHVCATYWPTMGFYTKCLTAALPVTASTALAGYCVKGYRYDHLLGRKKLCLTSKLGFKSSLAHKKLLGGPPVASVNQLLNQLITVNSSEYALQAPIYRWQAFVFEQSKDWYDFNEGGQLFLSKDILLRLTKNELTAFLSIQVAHTLAKHATEINSNWIATCYTYSLICGLYAFCVPRIFSFTADMALIIAASQIASFITLQVKYRSLVLEADSLALKLAKKCNVNEEDFISLFGKLVEARKTLVWGQRATTYCYFDARIKNIESLIRSAAT